ncbi:hypothetical protein CA234_09570 [Sphingomonas sp. ABOLE]|nr:hypothetical protein CA234_09570 [Sphingomonas sp. ABOLE]
MRISFSGAVCWLGAVLLASMLIRCVVATYQPRSPEVASATPTLVVASSAQARTLAPAAEAGRSTYQGQHQ